MINRGLGAKSTGGGGHEEWAVGSGKGDDQCVCGRIPGGHALALINRTGKV